MKGETVMLSNISYDIVNLINFSLTFDDKEEKKVSVKIGDRIRVKYLKDGVVFLKEGIIKEINVVSSRVTIMKVDCSDEMHSDIREFFISNILDIDVIDEPAPEEFEIKYIKSVNGVVYVSSNAKDWIALGSLPTEETPKEDEDPVLEPVDPEDVNPGPVPTDDPVLEPVDPSDTNPDNGETNTEEPVSQEDTNPEPVDSEIIEDPLNP